MLNLRRVTKKIQRGFTIVELAVVIGVIGILATVTIVGYSSMQSSAEIARIQGDYDKIENAISIYEAKHGVFPRCATSPPSNECDMENLTANLTVAGLPTKGPDGTPIRYVVGGSTYDRWAVRFKNVQTGAFCKQGFNPTLSWWGSTTTPMCW